MAKNVLNFDLGLERFYINNDKNRYLEFNPTDASLYQKFNSLHSFFEEISTQHEAKSFESEEDIMAFIDAQDKALKEKLDNIFGSGSCERVFGSLNLFSPTKTGATIFENFIEALTPMIEKSAILSHQESSKRIKKYTEKYRNGNI